MNGHPSLMRSPCTLLLAVALAAAASGCAAPPLTTGLSPEDDPADARAAVAPLPPTSTTLRIDAAPATAPAKKQQGGHDHAHH